MTDSTSKVTSLSIASPAVEAPSLAAGHAPQRSTVSQANEHSLLSIRGIPACESVQPTQLAPNSGFDEAYSTELGKLWTVARLDPRGPDRGGDLKRLVELFEVDESLIQNLNSADQECLLTQLQHVAESEVLFGKTRAQFAEMGIDFDRIRREFLVDIIRGTIDPDNITQGKEPLCTIASACKLLSRSEFLRVTTELALDGRTTTTSGDVLEVRPEFLARAYSASEASIGDVRCARRSMGMLTLLYSVMQLGDQEVNPQVALVDRQAGLYWHQYARMTQKLLGERVACAHRTANDICIDETTGLAVPQGTAGAKKVGLFDYVETQLKGGRRVFIDTLFDFSSQQSAGSNEHARHALIAEGFESIDGVRWVRCSNPIGDFVDTSKSTAGHAEFFPAGTVLGRGDGFWFKTDVNGDILVRADVLKNCIQTALVRYGDRVPYKSGDEPLFIGDRSVEDVRPVVYFSLEEREVAKTYEGASTAESILDALNQLFEQQEELARKAGLKDEPDGYVSAPVVRRKNPWEEAAAEGLNQLVEAELREDAQHTKAEPGEKEIKSSGIRAPAQHDPEAPPKTETRPTTTSSLMAKSLFG